MNTTTIPQLPAPDTTALQLLLLENGIDAYVGGWTSWGSVHNTQVGAGAYVIPYQMGEDARAAVIDVCIGAGFVCEESVASVTVHFDASLWVPIG